MIKPGAFLFDLDGVVYQDGSLIDGARSTINGLNNMGIPYRFVTNTTRFTKNQIIMQLKHFGLKTGADSVFSPPVAAAKYCRQIGYKSVCLFVQEPSIKSDFFDIKLSNKNPDAVIVGDMGKLFTFEILNEIFNYVLAGSTLIAMHKNRYWKNNNLFTIDLGGIIAAIEYSAKTKAINVGKPSPILFQLAINDWKDSNGGVVMVGDDVDVDVFGAKLLGLKTVLVKTGKFTERALDSAPTKPDFIINSINELIDLFY